MTLRTLNYGNYGIFLIMGNAGFSPSTVGVEGVVGLPLLSLSFCGPADVQWLNLAGQGIDIHITLF